MATNARIIRIGNSRGIRVPKALLEQAQLSEEVELLAQPGRLVISNARKSRAGWSVAAKAMLEAEDDVLLDEPTPTRFDEREWSW